MALPRVAVGGKTVHTNARTSKLDNPFRGVLVPLTYRADAPGPDLQFLGAVANYIGGFGPKQAARFGSPKATIAKLEALASAGYLDAKGEGESRSWVINAKGKAAFNKVHEQKWGATEGGYLKDSRADRMFDNTGYASTFILKHLAATGRNGRTSTQIASAAMMAEDEITAALKTLISTGKVSKEGNLYKLGVKTDGVPVRVGFYESHAEHDKNTGAFAAEQQAIRAKMGRTKYVEGESAKMADGTRYLVRKVRPDGYEVDRYASGDTIKIERRGIIVPKAKFEAGTFKTGKATAAKYRHNNPLSKTDAKREDADPTEALVAIVEGRLTSLQVDEKTERWLIKHAFIEENGNPTAKGKATAAKYRHNNPLSNPVHSWNGTNIT